jgi:hypothetical protein
MCIGNLNASVMKWAGNEECVQSPGRHTITIYRIIVWEFVTLDVICAIDLLLLPLINVINFFISDENKSTLFILFSICATFYYAPQPF